MAGTIIADPEWRLILDHKNTSGRTASEWKPTLTVSGNFYNCNEVVISRLRSSLSGGIRMLFSLCQISAPQTRLIVERNGLASTWSDVLASFEVYYFVRHKSGWLRLNVMPRLSWSRYWLGDHGCLTGVNRLLSCISQNVQLLPCGSSVLFLDVQLWWL